MKAFINKLKPAGKKKYLLIPAILAVSVALYIAIAPFIPAITFWYQKHQGFKVTNNVAMATAKDSPAPKSLPKENRLLIPSIGVDTQIFDGTDDKTVDLGVWHRPNSSNPDNGGNTVMVGHRFEYWGDGGQAFYNLDKVNIGDKIILFWNQKRIIYTVSEVKVVPRTQVDIESQTSDARLTLYTCTPLWYNTHRLVVVAYLTS